MKKKPANNQRCSIFVERHLWLAVGFATLWTCFWASFQLSNSIRNRNILRWHHFRLFSGSVSSAFPSASLPLGDLTSHVRFHNCLFSFHILHGQARRTDTI